MLGSLGLDHADAVFFDLGVSSMQLDVRERGFAYSEDAPLDMRMDPTTGQTAADLLNTATAAGADPHPAGVRRGEVRQQDRPRGRTPSRDRRRSPRAPSSSSCSTPTIPAPARRTGGHPAKRTFQALRMAVNDELAVLRRAIPAAIEAIGVGGRVVVESYHSLEDRLVKRAFADATRLDVPARPAVRARGRRARAAPGHPRRRAGRRARDRREPPRRLRPAARRRARPSRPRPSRHLPPGVVR